MSSPSTAAGLRIAYVVEEYCSFIGDEIRALRRLGVAVELLAAFRPLPQPDPDDEELRHQARYFPDSKAALALEVVRVLARAPLRLVLLTIRLLQEGNGLRMAALACWFARVVETERLAHLHATYSTRTATLAWAVDRLTGVGYSFTTHANDMWSNPSILWKTRDAHFVRTISDFNRGYLEAAYGVASDRVVVCRLGVDTKRFQPGTTGSKAVAGRIISVGRLVEIKGHAVLLDACARLRDAGRDFSCHIVGTGPLETTLSHRIEELALGHHVRLVGWLTRRETLERLESAQVFALPCVDARSTSTTMDGIPVALMEAMAAGLPVVSTPVSGISELVEDGRSGLLVAQGSATDLAAALSSLLQDAATRRRLGEAARARVVERFDLLTNAATLRDSFQGAIYATREPGGMTGRRT